MTDTISSAGQDSVTPDFAVRGSATAAGERVSGLADQLQAIAFRQQSKPALFEALLQLLVQQANIIAGAVLVSGPQHTFRLATHRLRSSDFNVAQLKAWLQNLHADDVSQVRVAPSKTDPRLAAIIAPLGLEEHLALMAIVKLPCSGDPMTTEIAITQLFTTCAGRWRDKKSAAELSQQLSSTAAVLEIVRIIESSDNVTAACIAIVAALQKHLGCERVVIGLRPNKGVCHVRAISGVAEVDETAELTRKLQAVLNEAVLRDQVSCWPPLPGTSPHQLLAHKQLARRDAAVISTPLRTAGGEPMGALAVEGRRELAAIPIIPNFVATLDEPLGSALQVVQRAEGSWPLRCLRAVVSPERSKPRWIALCLLVLAVTVLLIPVPYKMRGRCLVEPVERRFCVAPHDGLLENTFAEAGDIVRKGQLLARMDGREIRWELAGTHAEMHRAAKKRDTHMAHHETADALLAELEMKRLDSQSQLLKLRERSLELASPSDGMVLSGSLDRRENYPVSKGQILYEIAPLHPLRVEVGVPADEVTRLRLGMAAQIRLEGLDCRIVGTVNKIRPRAEVRDEQNVFVAEVLIDNTLKEFRPGMKGQCKIVSDARSVGWIVFHRLWERIVAAWPW